MTGICKTIKIVSTDKKSQGDFIEINETDFDAEKGHVLFEATDAVEAQEIEVTEAKAIKKKGNK